MDRALNVPKRTQRRRYTRYPLAPLKRLAQLNSGLPPWSPSDPDGFSDDDLAVALHVTRRTVVRWAQHGVPRWSADRIAVRLGLVPTLVWPDWS